MSEPEPSVEPEIFSTMEPEPEVTSEPEMEPGPMPESIIFIDGNLKAEPEKSWPEPEPEWSSAFNEWGTAWPLHVYIFGLCYALALLYSVLCMLSLIKTLRSGRGKLTVSLLIMVALFNITRTVALFADPYYAFNNIPFITSRIIWSVGLPFLTSSFSLVFLVLLDTTKMDIGPPKFQKFSAILVITCVHVVIVVSTDFIVLYEKSAKALLLLCKILFMLYGLTLAIGYLYVGIKMRSNCSAGKMHESTSVNRLIVLCFVSSATSAGIVCTHIYSAVGVFGVYSTERHVEAWPWWILQTFLRIEELISVCVVLTIVSNSEHLKGLFIGCWKWRNRVKSVSIQQPMQTKDADVTMNESLSKSAWSS